MTRLEPSLRRVLLLCGAVLLASYLVPWRLGQPTRFSWEYLDEAGRAQDWLGLIEQGLFLPVALIMLVAALARFDARGRAVAGGLAAGLGFVMVGAEDLRNMVSAVSSGHMALHAYVGLLALLALAAGSVANRRTATAVSAALLLGLYLMPLPLGGSGSGLESAVPVQALFEFLATGPGRAMAFLALVPFLVAVTALLLALVRRTRQGGSLVAAAAVGWLPATLLLRPGLLGGLSGHGGVFAIYRHYPYATIYAPVALAAVGGTWVMCAVVAVPPRSRSAGDQDDSMI